MTTTNDDIAVQVTGCALAGCLVIAFFVALIAAILGVLKLFGVI